MKIYEYNGKRFRYEEGKAPDGAVLVEDKPVVENKEEVKEKLKPLLKNKARKASSTK